MKTLTSILLIGSLLAISASTYSQSQTNTKEKPVEVGGAVMNPVKDIIANTVNSKDHTTLVAAIKAADLVETLQSSGPFTVFAPTNEAFDLLPAGTVAALLKAENKGNLNNILKYHVVPGKLSSADIVKLIKAGNGSATLTTVAGKPLVLSLEATKLLITDEKGDTAVVTIKDVNQSNGIVHVIDHVLLPKEL